MEFSYVVDTGLSWPSARTRRKITDHIQIHHTVGIYGTSTKWAALHKKRQAEGQRGVPYSYLICQDGTIFLGRGLEYSHGGVKDSLTTNEKGIGANQRSVAIAFDGDMRKDDLPTTAQLASAVRLVQDILRQYPGIPILGHNEVPTYSSKKLTGKTYATLCPCIDMANLRELVKGAALPEAPEPEPVQDPDHDLPAKFKYSGATYSNIRSGPGVKYPAVGKISKGETCDVTDVQSDASYTWFRVTLLGVQGWCTANYLKRVD